MGLTTTRRTVLALAGVAAAGTVAVAAMMRKPPPVIYTPVAGPDPQVRLEGPAALVATEPPKPVAAFGFTDAAGAQHAIGEYAGRGVVLNLWATWCVPCVAELPALAALARQVAGARIAVLPLSTDRGGAAVVQKFLASHNLAELPVLLDPKGEAAEALGARGVPTTIVIDRHGRERARLEGAADWSAPDMIKALQALIG